MSTQLPPWLREENTKTDTYVLALYCQPGAKKTEVQGEHDGRLKIRLAAPPVEGKANDALILWLSKTLDVNRSAIELLAGDLSRLKRVRVIGITAQAIIQNLQA
ncbi:MAG: DUF167 domain-containing protein [Polynucleobacter sp.]|mgnify:FL=1